MCVGSPTAGTWSSSQWRPDNEFETDRITKAVKLVTGGRIGPALDSEVRKALGIPEPRDGAQWLAVLKAVARDIQVFEATNGCQLEELVEPEWQPVAVGRVYDMIFGPKGS